jgi:hypothetical protein
MMGAMVFLKSNLLGLNCELIGSLKDDLAIHPWKKIAK